MALISDSANPGVVSQAADAARAQRRLLHDRAADEGAGDEQEIVEIRDEVEHTIARNAKLRQMAERCGYTPGDVASEALTRYLASGDSKINNPAAWMVTAGRNFVYDLHRKGIQREEPSEPGSWVLDQSSRGEQESIEETLDRRYEYRLFEAAVGTLDERDQRAIAAFGHAGSVRAVERHCGISKSTVHRAFKHLHEAVASETGGRAGRRTRSRAVAYHLGHMSSRQKSEFESRLTWDTNLVMELRALQFGGRYFAGLISPATLAASPGDGHGQLLVVGRELLDKLRDSAFHVVGRGPESEAASGAAGLGGGAVTAKVAIGLCATAASVGGVCVGTGVVPAPGLGKADPPAAGQTTTTAPAPQVLPAAAAPVSAAAADANTTVEPTTPAEQQKQEFGASSKANVSGKTREFGAAPTSRSSSSSGGSGGGGGSGRQSFGL